MASCASAPGERKSALCESGGSAGEQVNSVGGELEQQFRAGELQWTLREAAIRERKKLVLWTWRDH